MRTALITGGSAGLGKALAEALATRGWRLIVTARRADRLRDVAADLAALQQDSGTPVVSIAGDVADPDHRAALIDEVNRLGSLDLLVNNASTLGPTPLRPLSTLTVTEVKHVLDVNVLAPFALAAASAPAISAAGGSIISISSDAAVEHYAAWGAYGASKAALDHLTLTFGVENDGIHCYAMDPGDMRTDMQQAAFPGEDISDRRLPQDVVPAVLQLIVHRPPSGRYLAGTGVAIASDGSTIGEPEPSTSVAAR